MRALTQPCAVTRSVRTPGPSRPAATSRAMTSATAPAARLPVTSAARRGMRSASAPPTRRQQSDRQEGPSGDRNGPGRLARVCDHERPDGDRLHPRSDDRHEATRPQERVVPVTQRCERGEPCRLGGPRGASRLSLRLRDRLRIERRRLRVPGHRVRLGGAHLARVCCGVVRRSRVGPWGGAWSESPRLGPDLHADVCHVQVDLVEEVGVLLSHEVFSAPSIRRVLGHGDLEETASSLGGGGMEVRRAEDKRPRPHHVAHSVRCSFASRQLGAGSHARVLVPVRLPSPIRHELIVARFRVGGVAIHMLGGNGEPTWIGSHL